MHYVSLAFINGMDASALNVEKSETNNTITLPIVKNVQYVEKRERRLIDGWVANA